MSPMFYIQRNFWVNSKKNFFIRPFILSKKDKHFDFRVGTYILTSSIKSYRLIGLVGRAFANGPGDLGSVPKTLKMVLDTCLLYTQPYMVRIFWLPSTTVANLLRYTKGAINVLSFTQK